jgi:hypothetical protein
VSEKGNWPQENEIGLPMANPPPPANHKLMDAKRFFSKFLRDLFLIVHLLLYHGLRLAQSSEQAPYRGLDSSCVLMTLT